MRPTLYGLYRVSQRSTYPARTSTVRRTTRTTAPASPKLSQSTVTKGASAPLIYSPEFAYPALRPGPPPGSDGGHPGGTPSYTLRASSGGDLVFSGSSARKHFPQKSLLWYRGGGVQESDSRPYKTCAHFAHFLGGRTASAMPDRPTLHPLSDLEQHLTRSKQPCQNYLPCKNLHTAHSQTPASTSKFPKALSAYPTVPRPYHLAPSLALRGLFPTLSVISLRSAVLRSPWWEIGAKIRLTLSGSWQQGHSTAYRTVSHS